MEFIFFTSAALVAYMFVGYPIVLKILQLLKKKAPEKPAAVSELLDPSVSIVIAAHNEEANIVAKIENLLAQTFPITNMQIIVGSDGSTDGTVKLLEQCRERAAGLGVEVEVLAFSDRRGKPSILNRAVQLCKHEIIVFADVRQTFADNAIENLIKRFVDPMVGAVSGELFLREPTDTSTVAEAGAYWRYEKLVRKREAKFHSTIGATGAIYAIRKSLYREIPERTLIDDVVIPMQICMQGYRVQFANDAHAFDIAPTDSNREWFRKVRTLAGNWQMMSIRPEFFNPFKNPVWLQFMSHKIMRLCLPFCLTLILLASYASQGSFFATAFTLQCLVYGIGVVSFFSENVRQLRLPGLIYFVCLLNAAIIVSFYRLATGQKEGLWTFAYKSRP